MCIGLLLSLRRFFAELLNKFGLEQGIYYVNGPDTLPPPLTSEEENEAVALLEDQPENDAHQYDDQDRRGHGNAGDEAADAGDDLPDRLRPEDQTHEAYRHRRMPGLLSLPDRLAENGQSCRDRLPGRRPVSGDPRG